MVTGFCHSFIFPVLLSLPNINICDGSWKNVIALIDVSNKTYTAVMIYTNRNMYVYDLQKISWTQSLSLVRTLGYHAPCIGKRYQGKFSRFSRMLSCAKRKTFITPYFLSHLWKRAFQRNLFRLTQYFRIFDKLAI